MAITPFVRANSEEVSPDAVVSPTICHRQHRSFRRFARDEEGSTIIFSLFIFIMMLMIGGMAVDLMNFETRRAKLQATIDAAVLAAADLDQTVNAEDVVRDYFAKSGLDPNLVTVTSNDVFGVDDTNARIVTSRTVAANMNLEVNTFFMDLVGIEQLATPVASAAHERVQNVEISLIVDISGSMGGTKIANLKTAAAEFFDAVIDPTGATGTTSISIIPYNMTVNAGDTLLSYLNAGPQMVTVSSPSPHSGALTEYPDDHTFSNCVSFDDSMFISTDVTVDYPLLRAITPTTPLTRISHFRAGTNGMAQPTMAARYCNSNRSEILVHETSVTKLTQHINAMTAGGNTGIDNGMKWGVALLDPSLRPVINTMVDDGVLSESVRNRPFDYGTDTTMKVVVLMTDGQNTSQNDIKPQYKKGPSRVWYSDIAATPANQTFKVTDAFGTILPRAKMEQDGYFIEFPDNPADQRWLRTHVINDFTDGVFYAENAVPADLQQMHYIELYDRFAEEDLAMLFGGVDTVAYNEFRNAVEVTEGWLSADARLDGICDAAKQNNDIMVYTIAFEAPAAGQSAMLNCASSPGFYFDVAGTNISEAFAAVASQITALRLTQ